MLVRFHASIFEESVRDERSDTHTHTHTHTHTQK